MSRTGLLISNHECQCGIERVAWHERLPNLIDYDFVILEKTSLNQLLLDRAKGPGHNLFIKKPPNALRDLRDNLKLIQTKVLEILPLEDRRIFVMYEPPLTVRRMTKKMGLDNLVDTLEDFIDTDDWCPFQVLVHEESGKHIRINDDSYTQYLNMQDGWSYYFLTERLSISDLWQHYNKLGQEVSSTMSPIAMNRAGQALSMSIRFNFAPVSTGETRKASPKFKPCGELVFLPPGDDMEESVETILRIADPWPETLEPAWITEIKVPEEDQLLTEVSRLRHEAQEVEDSLDEKRRYKRLLYEDGMTLQDLCGEAFELLGATVKISVVSDEFILEVDGEEVLVEVKGHSKSVLLRDLSQLIKDVGNHIDETKQDIHGLLVGNAWRLDDPSERNTKCKPVFPDNVVRTAKNHGVGLLSTTELFQACCRVLEQPATRTAILARLIEGRGIIKLT